MLSMGAEIDQRISATNRAWRGLYGTWWNKRVPYKIKRTLFRGAVCGPSLTGLTALLLHDRDYLRLQRCLEKKLRALVLGTDSWEGQVDQVAIGAPCLRIVRAETDGTRASPENQQGTHILLMLLVGYECISKRYDTLRMVNVCIFEANGYGRMRLLTDLQAPTFVPDSGLRLHPEANAHVNR